jgi:hypothetical protein
MTRYKDYPIHANAEPTNTGAWCAVGIVYAPADVPTTELKRLHTGGVIIFPTEKEAEEHGLALCKAWIDDFERRTNWKDRIEFER